MVILRPRRLALIALLAIGGPLVGADRGGEPLPAAQPDFAAQQRAQREGRTPVPFDVAAYRADPRPYLDSVDPGRASRPARAALGVPELTLVGDTLQSVPAGGTLVLRLQAPARAPVSLTAPDGGRFGNDLPVITVVADERGAVEVSYTATPDAVAVAQVLAACPLAQRQVQVAIRILAADAAGGAR